jgi:hypothetical protein
MSKAISIFLFVLVLAVLLLAIFNTEVPTNCWDKYQTEYEAITNCEKH